MFRAMAMHPDGVARVKPDRQRIVVMLGAGRRGPHQGRLAIIVKFHSAMNSMGDGLVVNLHFWQPSRHIAGS
jgi:hypothetical protein